MKKNLIKKINNRKGFTLIELLAVIIILAILMLIAVPGILKTVNKSRVNTFIDQSQIIYKTAKQEWASNLDEGSKAVVYSSFENGKSLELEGNENIAYCVKIGIDGNVTEIRVSDSSISKSINLFEEPPAISAIKKSEIDTTFTQVKTTDCSGYEN